LEDFPLRQYLLLQEKIKLSVVSYYLHRVDVRHWTIAMGLGSMVCPIVHLIVLPIVRSESDCDFIQSWMLALGREMVLADVSTVI
jgi:hypothetical protein